MIGSLLAEQHRLIEHVHVPHLLLMVWRRGPSFGSPNEMMWRPGSRSVCGFFEIQGDIVELK